MAKRTTLKEKTRMDEIMAAIAKARGSLAHALAHLDIIDDFNALKDALGAHDAEAVAGALSELRNDASAIVDRIQGKADDDA